VSYNGWMDWMLGAAGSGMCAVMCIVHDNSKQPLMQSVSQLLLSITCPRVCPAADAAGMNVEAVCLRVSEPALRQQLTTSQADVSTLLVLAGMWTINKILSATSMAGTWCGMGLSTLFFSVVSCRLAFFRYRVQK